MISRAFTLSCRLVGAVVIAGLLLVAFTRLPNALAARVAVGGDIGPADAIVVLGASINRDGTLPDSSLRRAVAGIRLYHAGLAPRVIMLGMYGEGAVRARLATDLGVPAAALTVLEDAHTTRHEAWSVADALKPQGARTVLLVTDSLHLRRARLLFVRAGLTVRPAPTDTGLLVAARPESRIALTRALAQELVGLFYHRLFGYV
jgi:uncharacterized SAM-binding protein YcdF (DUF218 family)